MLMLKTSWGVNNKSSVLCARILQKPELAGEIDAAALGKLLPDDLLEPLEEQFLSKQQVTWAAAAEAKDISWMLKVTAACCFSLQDELTTCVGRVLEGAKEKWTKGEEPTREDNCFVSPVAYDIIQVQNQEDNMTLKRLQS